MEMKKILIVDDDPDILDSLEFELTNKSYEVVSAINGWEALGAVRACAPDLVILDVMMPKENGYRVARMIKEDEENGVYNKIIPIIFLTARHLGNDPDREKIFMNFSKADSVVYKPFDMEQLVGLVEEMLSERKECFGG